MPRFDDGPYDASELATFQQAYEDACRKLGLNPKTSDFVDDYSTVRNRLAAAIMDAARRGERGTDRLRDRLRIAQLAFAEKIASERSLLAGKGLLKSPQNA